ncbi:MULTISPECIES: homoserine kinase [Rhodomicrobium]|uniref:homoserine kinase n=1 Tax=Rhodomicrobium TaxID=1068 RepID=UPI000B4B8BA8|nr:MULTISPECIES: homoserine kinase [Rhodomicrobium]
MAVYTEVSDDELTEFLARYDVGTLVSVKGIAEGVENSNFLITTSRGPYLLTLYEKRVSASDLPFFIGLMEHMAGQSIPCPTPIRDRSGQTLQQIAGRPAALISFLPGYSVRRPRAEHCAQLGESLAGFHLAGASFGLTRENALSLAGWRKLVEATAARADDLAPGLAEEIAREFAFLQDHWPSDLPSGVIHADLFPDNVFFLDEKISGLIDFYFACNDLYAYDLVICLNAWCFEQPNAINVTKARALLRGYGERRPLSAAEIEALPVLARGAALRFLLTRLYDWFHTAENALVRPKDPLEYRRKLRFHQQVASANDYGL